MVACAQVHALLGVFVRRGSARGRGDEQLPLHRRLHLPLGFTMTIKVLFIREGLVRTVALFLNLNWTQILTWRICHPAWNINSLIMCGST